MPRKAAAKIAKKTATDQANEVIELESTKQKKAVSQKTNTVESLAKVMKAKLEELYETSANIKREGNVIVVPEFMTIRDAANALVDWESRMEEETEKRSEWIGHPDDLFMAMYNGLKDAFGNVVGTSMVVGGFFGPRKISAKTIRIKTDYMEAETVPAGKVELPGVPVGIYISVKKHPKAINRSRGFIDFEYKNKYEPLVQRIEECVTNQITNHSIFKYKALNSKFEFVNPSSDAVDKLVYSRQEERDIETHIFQPIKNTGFLQFRGISLKRTVLLCGKFGTGKTLTALKAAQVCLENEWTFMNVVPGDDIEEALNFARAYEPCLVFFEDIDQVTSGQRDQKLNAILNTIDGALSKSARVMTILTTNNTDAIEKAMLRPGRIDAVIEMGNIDEKSFKGMVEVYCGDALTEKVDLKKLMPEAEGFTPSFIAESCNRAVMYAMSRNGKDPSKVKITNLDIFDSLKGLRPQFEMMIADKKEKPPLIEGILSTMVDANLQAVHNRLNNLADVCDSIKEEL